MKKLILIIIGLFVSCTMFSEDLFSEKHQNNNRKIGWVEINKHKAQFRKITDVEIDTFSVYHFLPDEDGFSLICFSENWCVPSYREFNRLYNDSIIGFLKSNNTRLIVLAQGYPFININRLDSLAKNNIESDFEIYYYSDVLLKTFPSMWLIGPRNRLIYHSVGVKEDYSQIKKSVEEYINNRCSVCGNRAY